MIYFSFMTLKSCTHIDGKHSIFGEVVGGLMILETINNIPCNDQHRPVVKYNMI